MSDVYYAGTEAQKNALIDNGWGTYGNDPFFNATWHYAVASGECGEQGDNLLWTLYNNGTFTVSGEGAMADWDSNGAPWYSRSSAIKSIMIGDGVTSIGGWAFYGCSALTGVTLPDSLTGIGEYAFENCRSLTGIVIPAGVTGIGISAFLGCSGLTEISLPGSLTSISDYAFSACSGLTSITLPEGVTAIGEYAFYYCSALTDISIPKSVTSLGRDAFSYCGTLTDVTYGGTEVQKNALTGKGWETEGNDAFFNATWHYSGHDHVPGETVCENTVMPTQTEAGHCDVVVYCAVCGEEMSRETRELPALGTLTVLDLPEQLTAIEAEAFAGADCEAVLLPAGMKSIGSRAFENCAKLRYVYFPAGIEIAPDAFEGCEDLLLIRTK